MSYLVLARKYRPQTFDEVVDQEHVTQTLKNAITANRVAHAMLFAGPRGTGKTTIARILAKSMNCQEGPTPVPCNKCRSCKEITAGSAADVFEIDGASNNSVDQIRELRENVKYMPQLSPYKIYIIDEVHMLSISAFNALLKTLEEPPAHVMFLFATTEAHKIPITILSRCQRHDLKRITLGSITQHMSTLCAKEKIDVTAESLGLIARESGGCMRDALSLLDQVISCTDGPVDYEKVVNSLGVIDRKYIFDMSRMIFNKDVPGFLDVLDVIYSRGHDLKRFYATLIEHFRNLYVIKIGKGMTQLVDLPPHEMDTMISLSRDVSEVFLSQILDLLFKEETIVKFSSQPKLAIEMVGIKMLQMQPPLPIDTLIEKLDVLRNEFYASGLDNNNTYPMDIPETGGDEFPTAGDKSSGNSDTGPREATISGDSVNQGSSSAIQNTLTKPAPPIDPTMEKKEPGKAWLELQSLICDTLPSLAAPLANSSISELTDRDIHLNISGNSFNINLVNRKKDAVTKIINEYFGKPMILHLKANVEETADPNEERNRIDKLRKEAIGHPLVKDAIEVFDGKILDIKTL